MGDGENSGGKGHFICNRKKGADVFLLPSKRHLLIEAELEDDAHHMRLRMVVDNLSVKIQEIDCEMIKIPDPVCKRAKDLLKNLVGKRVNPGLMKEFNGYSGEGCSHMKDLLHEACNAFIQGQYAFAKEDLSARFPGITEEQLFKIIFWFRPEIKNSCLRYADDAPFIRKVNEVELPEGTEKLRALAAKR